MEGEIWTDRTVGKNGVVHAVAILRCLSSSSRGEVLGSATYWSGESAGKGTAEEHKNGPTWMLALAACDVWCGQPVPVPGGPTGTGCCTVECTPPLSSQLGFAPAYEPLGGGGPFVEVAAGPSLSPPRSLWTCEVQIRRPQTDCGRSAGGLVFSSPAARKSISTWPGPAPSRLSAIVASPMSASAMHVLDDTCGDKLVAYRPDNRGDILALPRG